MSGHSKPRSERSGYRVLAQMVIIRARATTLGLVYNALSPDGIPLVKKAPTLQLK